MPGSGSHLLLRAFAEELARCGVAHACTSPGSRNSPLITALVNEPGIRCWSHIDERCAGFFALGAAKTSGLPVVLTCTSGTAAANLAPAVIEAWQARVPLIVLTADRPPELRDNGAGQAIDQLKLFGSAAKWFCEVGVDEATAGAVRWIRQLACRAYATARDGRPGPVHLNVPLREPLVLDGPLGEDPSPGRSDGRPWIVSPRPAPTVAPTRSLPARTVVVAGRDERADRALGPAAARFASERGYPLLADPLSGARHGEAAIPTYDLLLRDHNLGSQLTPELILRVGDLPTSKPLRAWLAGLPEVPQIAFDPERAWQDPAAAVSETLAADPGPTLEAWAAQPADTPPEPAWLAAWRSADALLTAAIDDALGDALSEPLVARRLGEWLPAEADLFVASSMAVRDVELFFGLGDDLPRVLSNRGANGIDGTVSAAYGAAAASGRPTVLLIGDVALAHDIGGLLAGSRLGLALTIVLLNNDGGGIFSFLPVADQPDIFTTHVATPHGLDFGHAAALYGAQHRIVSTPDELHGALLGHTGPEQTTIIEIKSDRGENLALHRRIAEAALESLRA